MRRVGERDAAVAAALAVLAAGVFGRHLLHGGLYRDDWRYWLQYATARPGLGGAIDAFHWTSFRPLQMLWWPATEAVLGPHAPAQIALTLLLAVLASFLLYRLLRAARMPVLPASACGALVLLFPAADAVRLWPAADVASAGISLYLLGALVSLSAFDPTRGPRARAALHAAGGLLYIVSIALYEVAVPAIVCSVVLYRLRASWRAAAARWAADLAAVVPFLVLVTSHSSRLYPRSPLRELPSHASLFGREALTLLSRSFVPFGRPPPALGAVVLITAGLLAAVRGRREERARPELGRWLLVLAAGLAAVVAGYAPYLLSDSFEPLAHGMHDRVNVVPSIGYALIVCATAAILVSAVTAAGSPARRPAVALAAVAVAAVGTGYAVASIRDVRTWDAAARLQRQTLATLVRALPRASRPSSMFVFGQFAFAGAGVPVFNEADDLTGALRARLGDAVLAAYPAVPGALFYCERRDVWMDTSNVVLDDDYGNVEPATFGRTIFVDGRTGRVTAVTGRAVCDRALARYRPGPLLPGLG